MKGLPMIHVYFAHRLSGPLRDENIEAAGRLMAECTKRLPMVPYASWITLARYWDEETGRVRGLGLDCAQITRCDELWLTGPEFSSGMQVEADCAKEVGVRIHDYIGLSVDEIVECWLSSDEALRYVAL